MADAKLIAELRKTTGAPLMECKKALDEAGDDIEKAIDILRSSGAAKAAKKADRETHEGVVRFSVSTDGKKGVMAEILCETDFVAKNPQFIEAANDIINAGLEKGVEESFNAAKDELVLKVGENLKLGSHTVIEGDSVAGYMHSNNKIGVLISFSGSVSEETGKDIALHAAAMSPRYISRDEVSAEDMEREKAVYTEQLQQEGKPEDIIEKIIKGKMDKFYEENCLLEQDFIKDEGKKIKDLLGDGQIKDFVLYKIG